MLRLNPAHAFERYHAFAWQTFTLTKAMEEFLSLPPDWRLPKPVKAKPKAKRKTSRRN
jgi:hypothetical protein